ncbi:hypothetical protein [uncultured Gemella sp.]|uniref:hypothetical protein n=1 Tax=uncultured Gemella sp. TaxID=254352 RepID=UPI0028D0072C|nr:hypothetical protein [uncultured Gemella sp.]
MLSFIFKKETILTSFYTILLSLLISKFLIDYTFSDKSIYDFFHFILLFIIFFNSWLLQVVHLNRYGKDSFLNCFFLTLQILTIFNLLVRDISNIKNIVATLVLLAVILSIQHITEYILTDNNNLMIKKLTEPFCYIHTARSLSLLLGLIFIDYGYWFILLSFAISQLFPSFISRSVHVKDINFYHLTGHLFIITNTIAISLWLSDLKINITTKIILLISIVFILLLTIYQKIFKTIDRTLTKQSGNTYIIGVYFAILEFIFINLFFVLEYDWKYIPLCIICYAVSYQSFKHYKKIER